MARRELEDRAGPRAAGQASDGPGAGSVWGLRAAVASGLVSAVALVVTLTVERPALLGLLIAPVVAMVLVGRQLVAREVRRQARADAMKVDFVARVSHELRTPITPIKGLAQALLRGGPNLTVEQHDRALREIVERAEHLGRIVEDLLLISRAREEGRLDAVVEDVKLVAMPIKPVVERVTAWLRTEAPTREVTVTCPAGLPLVMADPLRTTQILTNLLSNAAKYSAPGTPIELEVREEHGVVSMEVRDRGYGIPPHERENVFDAFHRLEDPLTMRTGGMGLGLYLARAFARAMGGDLTVEGRVGGGTTFRLTTSFAAMREPSSLTRIA